MRFRIEMYSEMYRKVAVLVLRAALIRKDLILLFFICLFVFNLTRIRHTLTRIKNKLCCNMNMQFIKKSIRK